MKSVVGVRFAVLLVAVAVLVLRINVRFFLIARAVCRRQHPLRRGRQLQSFALFVRRVVHSVVVVLVMGGRWSCWLF